MAKMGGASLPKTVVHYRAKIDTAEQVCQIVALACEAPQKAGRPISQWSGREIAEEIIERGIVATISERHAGRLLKRGRSSRTASATG